MFRIVIASLLIIITILNSIICLISYELIFLLTYYISKHEFTLILIQVLFEGDTSGCVPTGIILKGFLFQGASLLGTYKTVLLLVGAFTLVHHLNFM
jgi:hypothetical protein